jgi:hypothetical protein
MHAAKPSTMVVRDAIKRAARQGVRTRMVEELEESTGMSIAELAELTKK